MNKRRILWALLAVAVLAAAFVLWPRAESQGIFYRVSGGKSEMYVLGSIHIGSKEMYPFSRAIRSALEKADALVFECDTQSQQALEATEALMRYSPPQSLANHIGADGVAQLKQVAAKLGYDMEALNGIKPWAITSMLSMETMAAQMGTRDVQQASALGVEAMVRKQAGEKQCIYLETVEEQLGRMDAFSPALQAYLLNDACRTILEPEADKDLQRWPNWWASGDAQAFASSYQAGLKTEDEPELAREYHDSLITQRNRSMARALQGLLEGGEEKSYFVTVGLMHLVLEDDSILSELQGMGYAVEKIEN